MFWDIGSTNAYFALHLIKPILKRTNGELTLHPYNLGFALAMREFNLETPFIESIFCEYWENNNSDIQNYEGMAPIVKRLGVSAEEFEELCESDKIRQSLIDSTNEGIKRGVFGVPSIFVGNEMFWGKDRMEFVEDELMNRL